MQRGTLQKAVHTYLVLLPGTPLEQSRYIRVVEVQYLSRFWDWSTGGTEAPYHEILQGIAVLSLLAWRKDNGNPHFVPDAENPEAQRRPEIEWGLEACTTLRSEA